MLFLLGLRVAFWERSAIVLASLAVTAVTLSLKLARAFVVGLSQAHASEEYRCTT
ncbi:hypothetical protein T492DRAFT_918242 [Pavlovales sp. CCMP2436]|nr:hypothetical protein T492DRAFT_918242 [Pavlovales sp. CCMP2436]